MTSKQTDSLINKINYKDIIIILGIWYFMAGINYIIGEFSFNYAPFLTGLFHYFFILAGRFIYLALVIFYFISLYSLSFSDLGLSLKNTKYLLVSGFFLILALFTGILIFVNVPLSYNLISKDFAPIYQVKTPEMLISSLIPLILIFIPNIIIALSELLILSNIIYEVFRLKLNSFLAMILTGLFYSFLMLTFNPSQILINFIVALIAIYLYIKAKKSLMIPTLFMAGYYSLYILYIYGWDLLVF